MTSEEATCAAFCRHAALALLPEFCKRIFGNEDQVRRQHETWISSWSCFCQSECVMSDLPLAQKRRNLRQFKIMPKNKAI
jgi:hypothetical protein